VIVQLERSGLPDPPAEGAVVSVGVFDGVHLGHQAILAENVAHARALGAVPTVVTFRHHPKGVLLGRAPRTLTSLEHRLELFRRAGIARTVALTFDEDLRRISAQEFAHEFLAGRLGARRFVLGFDSKFGHDREGTPERLRAMGFDVVVVPEVIVADRPVSSTAIREAVELGDLDGAARMLGRPVAVYGDVVTGDGRGRQLGFPTANLDLHHELHPPPGVYACRVRIVKERDSAATGALAVANVGSRPTFAKRDGAGAEAPLVEVHLLDYSGDLYGKHLEVEFLARLREERRFADVGALRRAIGADIERARALTR
jgi:riboflavin kinase/FMN adenylyltransferase